MPRPLPMEVINYAKQLYEQGYNTKEIALAVGKSTRTIRSYLYSMDFSKPKNPKPKKPRKTATPEQAEEVNRLYEQGMPIRNISKQLRISRPLVEGCLDNKLPASVRVALGVAKAKSDCDELANYVDAVAPEMHRKDAILTIHRKQGGSYTEAETYYEAWRKEYMKRRAL